MKSIQDKINDFETEFEIDKKRWNKLRAEMYAERKVSYYDLESECKHRGYMVIFLAVLLFLCFILIYSLASHVC